MVGITRSKVIKVKLRCYLNPLHNLLAFHETYVFVFNQAVCWARLVATGCNLIVAIHFL